MLTPKGELRVVQFTPAKWQVIYAGLTFPHLLSADEIEVLTTTVGSWPINKRLNSIFF